MIPVPDFWRTDLETIDRMATQARRAQVRRLCSSAGGRPVWALCYGEPQQAERRANYNSACGGGDVGCYRPRAGSRPTVVLLGAVHGGETEGTAALVNLISLMETGVDLAGERHDELVAAAERIRLVIVPVCNPDGRARVEPPAIVGMTGKELRYWMQGTWKDGTLCGWPDCKKRHPIKDHVDFLGGYYNDDGVNLMHDNFFRPMAAETQALLDLCDEERPDWVIQLHGGSNSTNDILQPRYTTLDSQLAAQALSRRCDAVAQRQGLAFDVHEIPPKEQGANPPTFNLTSAIHHVCGAVSVTFESNECIIDEPGTHYDHEQIYRSHRILFRECFDTAAEKYIK